MKKLIAKLPTLTAPGENEELIIYLAAEKEAINAVLMTDREGRQTPVYFVSRTLRGPGVTYNPTEKTTGAVDVVHRRLVLRRRLRGRFEATNNEAEYEALIADLRIAEKMGIRNLQANVDSRLVANQVNGSYIAKESGMVKYLNKVKTLAKSFKEISIKQIPRSENMKADALSKIASTSFAHLNKQVLVEELKEKSINEKEILDIVEEE
ncbi:reverse transcriptase domain-containing protein, partial [Tanacetum coccineum]